MCDFFHLFLHPKLGKQEIWFLSPQLSRCYEEDSVLWWTRSYPIWPQNRVVLSWVHQSSSIFLRLTCCRRNKVRGAFRLMFSITLDFVVKGEHLSKSMMSRGKDHNRVVFIKLIKSNGGISRWRSRRWLTGTIALSNNSSGANQIDKKESATTLYRNETELQNFAYT